MTGKVLKQKSEEKMYIRLDKDYEIKTTLGTIRDIERVFGKSFFEVVNSISGMNVEDQLKLLILERAKRIPICPKKTFTFYARITWA